MGYIYIYIYIYIFIHIYIRPMRALPHPPLGCPPPPQGVPAGWARSAPRGAYGPKYARICTALCVQQQSFPRYGSLRWTRGPAAAPPFKNKTPAVARHRLPFCTTLCAHRLVCARPTLTTLRLATLNAGASPRTPLK